MRLLCVCFLLLLTACGGGRIDTPNAKAWLDDSREECVPYARRASGIQIYGDAHSWWNQAAPEKRRSQPQEGAVMVLAKTSRLKQGHLAVVKKVISDTEIDVTHRNWGWDSETRRYVYERMRVQDASGGQWTSARFWNPHSGGFGQPYKVSGFILR